MLLHVVGAVVAIATIPAEGPSQIVLLINLKIVHL